MVKRSLIEVPPGGVADPTLNLNPRVDESGRTSVAWTPGQMRHVVRIKLKQ